MNYKRFIMTAIIILIAISSLLIGVSLYFINYSLKPKKTIINNWETGFEYAFENYPHLEKWVNNIEFHGELKDTIITSSKAFKYHAYYLAAKVPTNKTAVLVHGWTDSAKGMLMLAYMYNEEFGYNVLLPNLHYHGLSEGKAVQMGWFDRFDVLEWMDVANNIFGGNTQMVVHGISMGAATTMMLSGESQKDYVKCFIEDCGYTSVWDQFEYKLKLDYKLPSFPLLNIANYICKKKYGWDFKQASALEQVKKSNLPMLFIHGTADNFVPYQMLKPLYEAKNGEKDILILDGVTHAMAYRDAREEYTSKVQEFLSKHVEN